MFLFKIGIILFWLWGPVSNLDVLSNEEREMLKKLKNYYGEMVLTANGDMSIRIFKKSLKSKKIETIIDDGAFEKLLVFKDRVTSLYVDPETVSVVSFLRIKEFSRLKQLYLDGTTFDDSCFVGIIKLSRLEEIVLNNSRVSRKSVRRISEISSLRVVGLSNIDISDDEVDSFYSLKNLEQISLEGTRITDLGLIKFSQQKHENLKSIFLNNTNITDKGANALKNIKTLNSIWIEKTKVSKKMVDEITKAFTSDKNKVFMISSDYKTIR